MSQLEKARAYVAKMPEAVSGSGGHAITYRVACVAVHGYALPRDQARAALDEYNARCQPPWSERELEHKLDEAEKAQHEKPRGHLVSKSVKHRFGGVENLKAAPTPHAAVKTPEKGKSAPARYIPEANATLPEPIADGCRELLKAAFLPGEGIRIAQAKTNEDGKEVPKDSGIVFSREEWLAKLDANGGDINKLLSTGAGNGIFISVNPMAAGRGADSDVTAFRHALVEWDDRSKSEQWSVIQQSGIPCAAVIDSGGKSVHAWVKVDAKDRDEYRERVAMLYAHFESAGLLLDVKNRNPSRFSRLAACVRGDKRQELLALNVGAENWTAWTVKAGIEPKSNRLPEPVWATQLAADKTIVRPSAIVEGALLSGGRMVIGGSSKTNKSWLMLDLAVSVASGIPWLNFSTRKARVLLADFELPEWAIKERAGKVSEAKGVAIPENILFWPLKGYARPLETIALEIIEIAKSNGCELILIDPIYKCFGDRQENDAGDVASLCNQLERLSLETGAAVAFAAHFSKGNQAMKESIDRISGSGVFARDPDTIMVLTKHSEEGAFVLEMTLRHFSPVKPSVYRFEFPLMRAEPGLDPAAFKAPNPKNPPRKYTPEEFMALVPQHDSIDQSKIFELCTDKGVPNRRRGELAEICVDEGRLHRWKVRRTNARPAIAYARTPQPVAPETSPKSVQPELVDGTPTASIKHRPKTRKSSKKT